MGIDKEASHFADGPFQTLGPRTFEIDAFGRITKIDSDVIEYDAFGRISKLAYPASAKLCYFGSDLWEERNPTSNAVHRQFTQHDGLGMSAIHSGTTSGITLFDARQNLTTVVDPAGAVNRRYFYEPFGSPNATSATTEPYFGGNRWSSAKALYISQTCCYRKSG